MRHNLLYQISFLLHVYGNEKSAMLMNTWYASNSCLYKTFLYPSGIWYFLRYIITLIIKFSFIIWPYKANNVLAGIFRFQHLRGSSKSLQWRHNELISVSNHPRLDCLFKRVFGRRSRKTSKLCVTGYVRGIHRWPVNSPHKWPVTRKMFPFDDVIMDINRYRVSLCKGWIIQFVYFRLFFRYQHIMVCRNVPNAPRNFIRSLFTIPENNACSTKAC